MDTTSSPKNDRFQLLSAQCLGSHSERQQTFKPPIEQLGLRACTAVKRGSNAAFITTDIYPTPFMPASARSHVVLTVKCRQHQVGVLISRIFQLEYHSCFTRWYKDRPDSCQYIRHCRRGPGKISSHFLGVLSTVIPTVIAFRVRVKTRNIRTRALKQDLAILPVWERKLLWSYDIKDIH